MITLIYYFIAKINKRYTQIALLMYSHLNIVSDHPHIPEEAFLFVPYSSNDPQIRDDFKIGEGKKIRRLLFQGWAVGTYTPYEKQQLKQFEQFLHKNKIQLDPRWDISWKLRWLFSTGCNHKKCVEDMQLYINFLDNARNPPFTNTVAKVLHSGAFYIVGRDCHYRPIIVFNVQKIIQLGMSDEELHEAQVYFLQYIMKNMFIPGQVETWVCLIDSGKQSLYSLMNSMKKAFSFLSDTYRSRLFACYNVNVTSMIHFIWSIIKKFLDETTVEKINLFEDNIAEPLLQYCNPSQFEIKFGGTHPNIQEGHFWPPREISKDYSLPTHRVNYVTKEMYTQYYKNKILYNTKFHQENILKEPKNIQLRENKNLMLIKLLEKQFKCVMESSNQESAQLEAIISQTPTLKPPLNYHNLMMKAASSNSTNINK